MATLTVIAKITAKPGQEEQVKQGLQSMLAPSRQEEGCLRYDLFQSNNDPAVFYTYEDWTGQNTLDNHAHTAHFQTLVAEIKDAVAQPTDLALLTQIGAAA